MKKASICAALIAAVLVAFSSLPTALGYFTTYTQARGGWPIYLGHHTDIKEEVSGKAKHLTIENFEDSSVVFVRAQGYCDGDFELTYEGEDGWEEGKDGYWYYRKPLQPGEKTTQLHVKINGIPEKPKEGDEFNVLVVYESTLALYDADGNPYPNWNVILDAYKEGA